MGGAGAAVNWKLLASWLVGIRTKVQLSSDDSAGRDIGISNPQTQSLSASSRGL